MKGEYVEEQEDNSHNHHHHPQPQNSIFPKYPPPHHPHFLSPHPHSFALPAAKPSEESHSPQATAVTVSTTPPSSKKPRPTPSPTRTQTTEDGGSIEVGRRPRGRPPGSKNKPKPPIIITREPDAPAMSPYILEVPGSSDVVESLTRFTRRRDVSLCVLTASGAVANVTLRQPSTSAPAGTVTFHGRFDILSLSAVVLHAAPFAGGLDPSFTISLAGPQGQIVGGRVVGPLLTAGTVYVIAASFNSPSFQRLPLDDHQNAHAQQQQGVRNDAVSSDEHEARNDAVSGDGGSSSGGGPVGVYSCHDVIWAPTPARPPHPSSQPY